jgi:hypothetical protein
MSNKSLPPTSNDLLEALEIFLQEEVTPQMQGYGRFRTRVALNILGMLRREQQMTVPDADNPEKQISWRDPETVARIKADNLSRLKINNPKWIRED